MTVIAITENVEKELLQAKIPRDKFNLYINAAVMNALRKNKSAIKLRKYAEKYLCVLCCSYHYKGSHIYEAHRMYQAKEETKSFHEWDTLVKKERKIISSIAALSAMPISLILAVIGRGSV